MRLAFAFATALLISGCSSVPKGAPTAASGQAVSAPELAQKASWSAYVSASPLSDQLTTATITDPSRNNMVAATMTIPAGWKLEGIEMMPPCTAAAATDWYLNAHVDYFEARTSDRESAIDSARLAVQLCGWHSA